MSISRSESVFKNASVSLIMQLMKNILGFISRTVFVYVLGAEYLGINSLFLEILTMLSFAELGIGNAMIFSLYKPIAEKDSTKIKSIMKLYASSYKVIGLVISVLGVCVIPFIKYIVGDVSYVKENLVLIYCLFLINSVISYFFVYKKSLIIADQKGYIVDIYQQIFFALQVLVQSIFLIVTRQFIIYLIITVIITFLNNYWVAKKADKMYPYLKDKDVQPLNKGEKKSIFTNIKALVVYKIGGIILDSTDSIFISSFINVITVGLYANYKLLINVFRTIGNQGMNSIIASVGNLNVTASDEHKESVFNEIFYLNVWFYGFTSVGLCILLTDLVEVWLGANYILSFNAVLAAIIYFYVQNMHYPCYAYRTTTGLFVFGQYAPLLCAIINIILNFILGKNFGLAGIFWASTISRVLTTEIIDPILIYKRIFHTSVLKYVIMYFRYAGIVLIGGFICYKISSIISFVGLGGLLLKTIFLLKPVLF